MAESKISPYSLNDLKNTTDDALGNYLRGLSFKQDNAKLDVRLAVGYTAVVIAAVIFVADYKLGWEATKGWTAVAVVAYSLLNGFFTYWMWGVEKGLVFEGARDGKKVCLIVPHVELFVAWCVCGKLTYAGAGDIPCIEDEEARSHLLPHSHNELFLLFTLIIAAD